VPFIGLAALVFAILYIVLSQSIENHYLDRLAEETASQARIAAFAVSEARSHGGTDADIVAMMNRFGELSGSRFTLIGPDGVVLADTVANPGEMDNHGERPEVVEAREGGTAEYRRVSDTVGDPFLYVAVALPDEGGSVMRVAVPVSQINEVVGEMGQSLLVAVLASLALALLASWLIAVRLSRPLEALRDQARAVGSGDYTARVEPSEIVELAGVGETFNSMAARLQHVVEQQERTSLRLESIMAGLVDGVVLTDGDGNVLRMNNAAAAMLDTTEASAVGRPFVQVSRDHELWLVLRDALSGKKKPSATVEHGLERASLLITARQIVDDGEQMGLVVLRDVTDLRRLETVRREFVANVSHELRTPLTSIRALVETLESGAIEEQDLAMDFLGRIVGEVDRLNALVEDLLDFARLEAGRAPLKLDRVNIGAAVQQGAERLRPQIERARLDLSFDIAENLPEMEVDTARIEQVMVNLLHNAIKFTPAGGQVVVRVYQRRNRVFVEVQDTGIGIPAEEQARLFERFYKSDKARRSEGTGLGLAIAKNIVQSHGGKISVESTPGEGATFSFSLPIGRKKALKRARKHALGLL
jgi:two-component system, OmpR family, phosphate regulon sensor histidine kinase PhoR